MPLSACNCPDCATHNYHDGEDLRISGEIHVVLALGLRDFIHPDSLDIFDRFRGGRFFAEALRGYAPASTEHFEPDHEENETVRRGYAYSLYRAHLQRHWLFDTFRMRDMPANQPSAAHLGEMWPKFDYRIRLSRMGLLEIKLTQAIPSTSEGTEPLNQALTNLLEIRSQAAQIAKEPIQWALALHCANQFVSALPPLDLHNEHGQSLGQLRFQTVEATRLQVRQRYTVLMLDQIVCARCGQRIVGDHFWTANRVVIGAILEGGLVKNNEGRYVLPRLHEPNLQHLHELASWEDELCVFSPERCLIYYPHREVLMSGLGDLESAPNDAYWRCVLRGIEHTVAARTALQILESRTTNELGAVSQLNKRITDGNIDVNDVQDMRVLAQHVSDNFSMLPPLRDVLVPTSAFRSGDAVRMFGYLNENIFNLPDALKHIERNIDELTGFLQYFRSIQLQEEIRQDGKREQMEAAQLNRVGAAVAIAALLIAAPSFCWDLFSFTKDLMSDPADSRFIWIRLLATLAYGVAFTVLLGFVIYFVRLKRSTNGATNGSTNRNE